jgi:hypothetical protein
MQGFQDRIVGDWLIVDVPLPMHFMHQNDVKTSANPHISMVPHAIFIFH